MEQMSREPGEKSTAADLHAEIEALRREVAELRTRRLAAAAPQRAAPSSGGGELTMTDELRAVMEELAGSIESGIGKRPVAYVLGALLAGILVGRMLSR